MEEVIVYYQEEEQEEEFPNMDLQLEEEGDDLEGLLMDYDPHNPSLDYFLPKDADSPPSHTPTFWSEPVQEAEQPTQKDFYFFPEESGFTDEGF